jgi:hypothetical protein
VVCACDIGHGCATFLGPPVPGAGPSIAALLAIGVPGVPLIIAALRDCTRDTHAVSGRMIVMALRTDGNQRLQLDEKQAITVGELSPTAHLALQHNQLLS